MIRLWVKTVKAEKNVVTARLELVTCDPTQCVRLFLRWRTVFHDGWEQRNYDGDSHRPQQAAQAGGALGIGAPCRGAAGPAGAARGAPRLPPAAAVAIPTSAASALRLLSRSGQYKQNTIAPQQMTPKTPALFREMKPVPAVILDPNAILTAILLHSLFACQPNRGSPW